MPLAFLTNANKNNLPKNSNSHIIKDTKSQVFKVSRIHPKKNLSLAGKKTIKGRLFFDYCVTYEWQDCNPSIIYPVPYCSPYSEIDALNWMANMYSGNVAYLTHYCHQPE